MSDERNDPKPLRKNVYLCDGCGAGWVSADMDAGVTPFMDKCPFCKSGMGSSLFYNVPQNILADKPARVEWYKPTEPEKAALTGWKLDHVEKGGLLRRAVSQMESNL